MVAVHGGSERDELVHACRAILHVLSYSSEVLQGFMDTCGKRDTFAFAVEKGFLRLAKQSPGSGEGK